MPAVRSFIVGAFAASLVVLAIGTSMVADPVLKRQLEGWSLAVIIATIILGPLQAISQALVQTSDSADNSDDTP